MSNLLWIVIKLSFHLEQMAVHQLLGKSLQSNPGWSVLPKVIMVIAHGLPLEGTEPGAQIFRALATSDVVM